VQNAGKLRENFGIDLRDKYSNNVFARKATWGLWLRGERERTASSLQSAMIVQITPAKGSGMPVSTRAGVGEGQIAQQIVAPAGARAAWAKPKIIVTGFGKTAVGGAGVFNEGQYIILRSITLSSP
jgi:hypothetical protein